MSERSTNGNVLTVTDLRTYFETEDGTVKAVDGISFEVKQGETLGIVGESGSGKSVANLSLMRLIPEPPGRIVSGSVLFHGRDILKLSAREIREFYAEAEQVLRHSLLTFAREDVKLIAQAFAHVIARERYTCYACAIMPDHFHVVNRKHKHTAEEMIQNFQDASRDALSAERANAQLAGQRLIAAVQLIKALGGGWSEQQIFANNSVKSGSGTRN